MIAWESLTLKDDLVPALDIRTVEGRHQEMEVRCQGLHDGDFGLVGAHNA